MASLSYEESMKQAERQRAMIEQLRNQQQPEGRMIGGHFVAPHWSQQLAPALNQVLAGYASKKQDEADTELRKKMEAEAEGWIGQRPMEKSVEQPGPPTEEGVGPEPKMVAPTEQEKLAWAQQGQRNPLTKALAAKYGEDVLLKEPERKQAREFKTMDLKAAHQARMDQVKEQGAQRIQELQLRLADQNLTREQRAEIQKQMDETKRMIAGMQAETARAVAQIGADARVSAAQLRADAKSEGAGEKPPKPLPAAQSKAWISNNVNIKAAQDVLSQLVDDKGNVKKEAEDAMNILYMVPGAEEVGQRVDPKGVPLRASIAKLGGIKVHDVSGATVTASEHPRLKPWIPTASDKPKAAADKVTNFMKEYKLLQQEIENYAETQGYRSPVHANTPSVTDPMATAPAAPAAKVRKFNRQTGTFE
jgi:hypothetical protein